MDDDEGLGPLFRAAAEGAPPPRFDHVDVVQASDRAVARRRSVLVRGAVALVVLIGAGGVGAAVLQQRTSTVTSTASAPASDLAGGTAASDGTAAAPAADSPLPGSALDPPAPPHSAALVPAAPPEAPPAPARGSTPRGPAPEAAEPTAGSLRPGIVPLGPGRSTCANRQDPALRALVDEALPDAVGAPAAATSDLCLPGGQRLVSIVLRGDVLTVSYLPHGSYVSVAPGFSSAPTASGGTVIVPAGYARLLTYLAPRL